MTFTTLGLRQLSRAAVVSMLEAYGQSASIKLTVYRGRPTSLFPPHAFIESITENDTATGPTNRQRTLIVLATIVWGDFDSGTAVDQADKFNDEFADYVFARVHEVHAATTVGVTSIDDVPVWNPDWGGESQRNTSYYATHVALEVYGQA